MQFLGRNTDFRTQTELATIRKARRSVHHDSRGIYLGHEPLTGLDAGGENCVRVTRRPGANLFQCRIMFWDNRYYQFVIVLFSDHYFFSRRHYIISLRFLFPDMLIRMYLLLTYA